MSFSSDRWSLIGRGSYRNQPSSGDDRVPSHDHNPSTHTYISDNPGMNTDITRIDTSRHSGEIISNPTYRPISDWLGVVYYRPRFTRGR